MVVSRLMAINGKELRENPNGGRLVIPDRIARRYSMIEWLEFERDMLTVAKSMGLDFTCDYEIEHRRTTFTWRVPDET